MAQAPKNPPEKEVVDESSIDQQTSHLLEDAATKSPSEEARTDGEQSDFTPFEKAQLKAQVNLNTITFWLAIGTITGVWKEEISFAFKFVVFAGEMLIILFIH